MTNYAALNDCKDRMLIQLSDTTYDSALNNAMNEASRVVDMFISSYVPYNDAAGNQQTVTPLNSADSQIAIITADIAVSIFKRRMLPEDVTIKGNLTPDNIEEIEARGWFGQGMQKMEQYIRTFCVVKGTTVTANVYNPEVFMDLYNRKIITAKEARAFMATSTSAIAKKLSETLTKIISDTETIIITRTETNTTTDTKNITTTDTKTEYHTKKQKRFAWIHSDGDNDGGYEQ